jgi:large subunit ribosomal protein L9
MGEAMKLILSETVERVGKMGEIVTVADGYARNYLLPRGLGLLTTPRNLKALEHAKSVIASKIKKEKLLAEASAQKIATLSLTFSMQASEEGKLFGSVTAKDISDAIIAQGISMDRHDIILEKPVKEVGSFFIPVKITHDVTAQVKIEVTAAAAAATE